MRTLTLCGLTLSLALSGCASEAVAPVDPGRVTPDMQAAGGMGGMGGMGGTGGMGGAGGVGGAGGGGPACQDADRDGYQDARCNPDPNNGGGDCNDQNNLINPGRAENCANRIDNDCNGLLPADDPACGGDCPDLDSDGFQDAACNADRATGGDCDDTNPDVNPGVGEICGNGRDDDCQDGDMPCLQNCLDQDLDGFGQGAGCYGPDCDDTDARVNPWRSEICGDNIDQDCDGRDLRCPTDCVDNDQDGFGVGPGCLGVDCNDDDPSINPGAREVPGDGIDQDCDGADLMLAPDCLDRDRDGYGEGPGCRGPDCDDSNPRVNPGRTEICGNRVDDDCSGGDQPCIFQGSGACVDEDGDGFGEGGCPNGNFDCDDTNPNINPFMAERCDGLDNDCDEQIDECPVRNQVCDPTLDRCVGQAGAPCQRDDQCAVSQGLSCDRASGQCRLGPGAACDGDAQCDPSAVCEDLTGICGDGPRCYRAKGGLCVESCDCADVWLCGGAGRCVECLNDGQCAGEARDTCSAGGFCVQTTPLGGAGNDARYQLFRRIIACWTAFEGSPDAHGCDALRTEDALFVGGEPVASLPDAETYVPAACDRDALTAAGFDGDDRAVLTEVFGCGTFELWNIWWQAPIVPNSEGRTCLHYAARKSGFGFPVDTRAAVIVGPCEAAHFD